MILWLDAQISPKLEAPLADIVALPVISLHSLGLASAPDSLVFELAREANAVVVTKDADFAEMATRLGSPPSIIWLRFGNRSNSEMLVLLKRSLWLALHSIKQGESIVEIREEVPT